MNKCKNFLKDGMIGKLDCFDKKLNWLPEETEKDFQSRLKKQPENWIYRTETITYTYNSNGHRCIDINDLTEGYILFAGCSHTEGVGLKLEHTYPYIVADHFKKQYYNLALGGCGPDVAIFNLLGFLNKVKHKPSILVIQWPNFYRFFNLHQKGLQYFLTFYNATNDGNYYKHLFKHKIPFYQNLFNREYLLQNLKNHGISNIIETLEPDVKQEEDPTVKVVIPMNPAIDFARDLCHGGIKTNEVYAKRVIEAIDKNFAHVLSI